jgi:2-oxoisovalerate dehydrogenase E2 component (dihydrolipoyl transacylase)
MARYEFKLPDIGEGIAEAEIVAWHIKIGDMVKEDQQLADMMTDKATVEMESPVAGRVVEVAGEVGDQIPIGSVLVVFETEADAPAASTSPPAPQQDGQETSDTGERTDSVAFTDGLVAPTEGQEAAVPSTAETNPPASSEVEKRSPEPEPRVSTSLDTNGGDDAGRQATHVLASPAVRQRARDLGVDLAQVKTTGDRVRHADLDAYLLYNGGSVSRTGGARRQDEVVKVVGLRRKIARTCRRPSAASRTSLWSRSSTSRARADARHDERRSGRQSEAHCSPFPDHGDVPRAAELPADQRALRR